MGSKKLKQKREKRVRKEDQDVQLPNSKRHLSKQNPKPMRNFKIKSTSYKQADAAKCCKFLTLNSHSIADI